MTNLQSIKELQKLCRKGIFRTWDIGQTVPESGEEWYTGWIHRDRYDAKFFATTTLNETLTQMLEFVKEGNDV